VAKLRRRGLLIAMEAKPSSEAEKHEKLKEKYNQVKQNNSVLKKGLIDKQEEYVRLEQQLKEKEAGLRQQLEEIDHLQFQNGRLSKQIGTLSAEKEELQKKNPQSGWSMPISLGGKQQQEQLQRAEDELRVLRDELMMKIQENEDLHMQLYEVKRQQEEDKEGFRESSASASEEAEQRESDLETEKMKTNRLTSETQELTQRASGAEDQLSQSRSLVVSLQGSQSSERREAQKHVGALRGQLARCLPFDDLRHQEWTLHNCSSRLGRGCRRKEEALQHLRAGLMEVSERSKKVLELWARTFGRGSDEESGQRLRLRSKMCESLFGLGEVLDKAIPEIIDSMGAGIAQAQPSASREKQFSQHVAALLHAHRKWVVHQSLLFLHDPNDAYNARSVQEEAQAQGFADGLWRLHRSVKALFCKLRLLLCVSSLSTRTSSSSHFELARKQLEGSCAVSRRTEESTGFMPPSRTSSAQELGRDSLANPGVAGANASDELEDAPLEPYVADRSPLEPPRAVVDHVRGALKDVMQGIHALGRCLSSWSASQAESKGGVVVELLESLHHLAASFSERFAPAMDRVANDVLWSISGFPHTLARLGIEPGLSCIVDHGACGSSSSSGLSGYLSKASGRLRQALPSVGFEEAMRTQLSLRQSLASKMRLAGEMRQQAKRLQEVLNEKANFADELRSLQDSHALLQSNLVTQKLAAARGDRDSGSTVGNADCPPPRSISITPSASASPGDLVLGSRQRALLDSILLSAQESAALRQRGFFVDTISLSADESKLAGGPPDIEAFESWELAVRKVYEQHVRSLQAQVQSADGHAMELRASIEQNADRLGEEEEAKQSLRQEVLGKQERLESMMEDMATTRKNYDAQLAMLTEHICSLSEKVSEKDISLASMQSHKILCGRCGMWNTMGKLLGEDAGGMCHTCKGKVLSAG